MQYENRRSSGIKASPSMAVSMAARKLRAEGRDIVDLSLGEPDFEPPTHVLDAVHAAVKVGGVRYGAAAGTESLRKAIIAKFSRDNQLEFSIDELTVANGAKQILFDTFLATLEEGDEVIIPTPCWVSYADIVALHGGKPVFVPCGPDTGFKLTASRLAAAITPKSRWLMLNSPSNPTGAIYSEDEYAQLANILEKHERILILSDEIYEHVLLSEVPFISFGTACPQLRERTLIVNGVSKTYAMTGWRVGYAAGPKALVAAINKMQSQSVTSVCSIAQVAAQAALDGDQAFVVQAAEIFSRRADLVADHLAQIADIDLLKPEGAFYAFIGVERVFGRKTGADNVLQTDTDVAKYLLEEFGVSSVPGIAFGAPGFIRLSIAASEEELVKACTRLREMVASLM